MPRHSRPNPATSIKRNETMELSDSVRKDAKDYEYPRLDELLRFRQNTAINRDAKRIIRNPNVLSDFANVDMEIWNFLRPLMSSAQREEMDKRTNELMTKAVQLAEVVQTSKRFNNNGIKRHEKAIYEYLTTENLLYQDLMVFRHSKGLDIKTFREYDKGDSIQNIGEIY